MCKTMRTRPITMITIQRIEVDNWKDQFILLKELKQQRDPLVFLVL
jgi:hypothetical protein